MIRAAWERLWSPVWAGAWTWFRWLFVAAAGLTHAPRVQFIGDAYAPQDMIFSRNIIDLADVWIMSVEAGYLMWALAMLGLAALAFGGRAARPGLVLWVVASWLLLGSESMNMKAYDRLLFWQALVLFFGPIGSRGLARQARSPAARWALLIVYCAIYGSTGWLKALDEPHWFDGTALAYNLVDRNFGNTPAGAWLSGQMWLCKLLGGFTVVFEASFPLFVMWRWTNPLVLLLGVGFHIGIWTTMHVGTFSWVALAAYPVLLHPAWARRISDRCLGLWTQQGFDRGTAAQP